MLVLLLPQSSDRSFSQGLMKILAKKSWFLHLAYQAQARSAADRDHLATAELKVQCLREELGAS
jgi:hypothetical protein